MPKTAKPSPAEKKVLLVMGEDLYRRIAEATAADTPPGYKTPNVSAWIRALCEKELERRTK